MPRKLTKNKRKEGREGEEGGRRGSAKQREREAERAAEEWVEAGGDAAIGIAFEGLPSPPRPFLGKS